MIKWCRKKFCFAKKYCKHTFSTNLSLYATIFVHILQENKNIFLYPNKNQSKKRKLSKIYG